ncbi:MAG TPA: DUF3099 domain-containing protein [Streptosporangiaceae bacterium]|nr:DUF3099 domain-containing protein [Streptosporangiaceae bacterium]
MRSRPSTRRDQAHLVTEARQSRSAEIGQRERRYLVMMGLRLVCLVVTVVMFVNHAGWLTAIPAAGAIALPYFAVVVANSRRSGPVTGFRPYEPRLPERFGGGTGGGGTGGGDGDGRRDGGRDGGGGRGSGHGAGGTTPRGGQQDSGQ